MFFRSGLLLQLRRQQQLATFRAVVGSFFFALLAASANGMAFVTPSADVSSSGEKTFLAKAGFGRKPSRYVGNLSIGCRLRMQTTA
jgi:hypothetical protein